MSETRTSAEWARWLGVQVLDPDGWREDGAPDFDVDLITLAEFSQRAIQSTVRVLSLKELSQDFWYE